MVKVGRLAVRAPQEVAQALQRKRGGLDLGGARAPDDSDEEDGVDGGPARGVLSAVVRATLQRYGFVMAKVRRLRLFHTFLCGHLLAPAEAGGPELVDFEPQRLIPELPVQIVLSCIGVQAPHPLIDALLTAPDRAGTLALPLADAPADLRAVLVRHVAAHMHLLQNLLDCCAHLRLVVPVPATDAAEVPDADASRADVAAALATLRTPPLRPARARLCRFMYLDDILSADAALRSPLDPPPAPAAAHVQRLDLADGGQVSLLWKQLLAREHRFLRVRSAAHRVLRWMGCAVADQRTCDPGAPPPG